MPALVKMIMIIGSQSTWLTSVIIVFQSTWVRASSPPTSLEQAPHIGRKSGSKDFTVPDYFAKSYLDPPVAWASRAGSTWSVTLVNRQVMLGEGSFTDRIQAVGNPDVRYG